MESLLAFGLSSHDIKKKLHIKLVHTLLLNNYIYYIDLIKICNLMFLRE